LAKQADVSHYWAMTAGSFRDRLAAII